MFQPTENNLPIIDARQITGKLGMVSVGHRDFQIQTEINTIPDLRYESIVVLSGRVVYQREEPVGNVADVNDCQRQLVAFHDETIASFCQYLRMRLNPQNATLQQHCSVLAGSLKASDQIDSVVIIDPGGKVKSSLLAPLEGNDCFDWKGFLEIWKSTLSDVFCSSSSIPRYACIETPQKTFFCHFISRSLILVAALNDPGALAWVKKITQECCRS